MTRLLKYSMIILLLTVLTSGCAERRIYDKANELAAAGDYEKALTQYRLLMQKHPDSKYASYAKQAAAKCEDLIQAGKLLSQGAEALGKQDYESAVDDYQKALFIFMKHSHPKSEEVREALIQFQHQYAEWLIELGDDNFNSGLYNAAAIRYQKAYKNADQALKSTAKQKLELAQAKIEEEHRKEIEKQRAEELARIKKKEGKPIARPSKPSTKVEVIRGPGSSATSSSASTSSPGSTLGSLDKAQGGEQIKLDPKTKRELEKAMQKLRSLGR